MEALALLLVVGGAIAVIGKVVERRGRLQTLELKFGELEGEVGRLRGELRAFTAAPATEPAVVPAPVVPAPAPEAAMPARQAEAPAPEPVRAPVPPPRRESARPAAAAPKALDLRDLLDRWEILGPRGFAIAGGAVTALGVVLLFVLAANRGWIGHVERVTLGALASALLFGAGIVLRSRYRQYVAALGAAGAGIAGGYATLAAAAALYDLVPDWLALALAAAIAAVAVAVSIRWSSEIVAGLGLVGSALAPALESIDTGLTPSSVAFALLVLAAAGVLAVARRWQALLAVITMIVGAQAVALLLGPDVEGDVAAIAVAAGLGGVLLASGCACQWFSRRRQLGRLALSLLLADVGYAFFAAMMLFSDGRDRGLAVAVAAAAWAAVWALVRGHQPDLALVLGISALALAAVATGDLLSDDALSLAWSAQAALLTTLASRLRDPRLAAMGYVYLTLGAMHALVVAAPPEVLFELEGTDWRGALAPAAVALAAAVSGAAVSDRYASTGEQGLLAWTAVVRSVLIRAAARLREALVFAAGAIGVYAAAVLLVGLSFDSGHVAATAIAAAAGAACVGVASQRRSTWLVIAGFVSLLVVLGKAIGFDVDELSAGDGTIGGWSALASGGGLVVAGVALRVLHTSARPLGIASGVAGALALLAANIGVVTIFPGDDLAGDDHILRGVAFALVAMPYLGAAAAAFRTPRLRNLSTTLWALGLVAMLEAEGFLIDDGRGILFAFALTGAVLAALARPLGELRLWIAGAVVTGASTFATLAAVTSPDHFAEASSAPATGFWVLAGCVAGLAVLAVTAPVRRPAAAGITAAVTLYAVSLGILDLAERVSGASVQTDFERGHTAVSIVWAVLGLGLLVVGLLRRSSWLRFGGLALFGVSLVKIFVYDLSELSSLARAFSFLAVGGLLLTGGFFLQRLSERMGPGRGAPT